MNAAFSPSRSPADRNSRRDEFFCGPFGLCWIDLGQIASFNEFFCSAPKPVPAAEQDAAQAPETTLE
jgi:hypothetical protein